MCAFFAVVTSAHINWSNDVSNSQEIGFQKQVQNNQITPNLLNSTTTFETRLNSRPFAYYVDYLTKSSQVKAFRHNDIQKLRSAHQATKNINLNAQISIMDIFYEKLQIENIVENDDDVFISLFSDIGGQLGLWLGVSIVSLMEILHFLLFSLCSVVIVKNLLGILGRTSAELELSSMKSAKNLSKTKKFHERFSQIPKIFLNFTSFSKNI